MRMCFSSKKWENSIRRLSRFGQNFTWIVARFEAIFRVSTTSRARCVAAIPSLLPVRAMNTLKNKPTIHSVQAQLLWSSCCRQGLCSQCYLGSSDSTTIASSSSKSIPKSIKSFPSIFLSKKKVTNETFNIDQFTQSTINQKTQKQRTRPRLNFNRVINLFTYCLSVNLSIVSIDYSESKIKVNFKIKNNLKLIFWFFDENWKNCFKKIINWCFMPQLTLNSSITKSIVLLKFMMPFAF